MRRVTGKILNTKKGRKRRQTKKREKREKDLDKKHNVRPTLRGKTRLNR
jgi:hypothetical protein